MKADDSHSNNPKTFPEVFSSRKVINTELLIAIQYSCFNHRLYQPTNCLLGCTFVSAMNVTTQTIQVIEQSCSRVIDKSRHHSTWCHLTQQFFLQSQADCLRVKTFSHCQQHATKSRSFTNKNVNLLSSSSLQKIVGLRMVHRVRWHNSGQDIFLATFGDLFPSD